MYQRFRDSLITPALIVEFRNDKILRVFAYILFFALLLSTRMIIDTLTYDGLSVTQQNEIAAAIPVLDPDCGFDDTSYYCATDQTTLLYEDLFVTYYLDSHSTLQMDQYDSQYNIVVQGENIYFIVAGTVLYDQTINTVPGELQGLDFSLQTSDPDQFEERVFETVDAYILQYKSIWGPMLIAIDFLTGLFLFMAFVLLSAMMMRFRFRQIPYRQMFVMTAYSSTALYLILIFNSLFQLNFFLVIILIFIAFRQNNQLSYEILKRLRKKP